jgi:GNAT superfamily N-acetyltransferase
MELLQGDLYVRKATLEYEGSARYDDQLRWACAARASATRPSCSRAGASAATSCWCAASWSTSSPTRHAVAYNRLGMPLGTGRLLEAGDGASRVGRMAVRADLRGSGIGRALLQALEGAARQRGDRSVVLDAQAGVEGFYTRTGYAATGRRFDAAGIAHVEMSRRLGA